MLDSDVRQHIDDHDFDAEAWRVFLERVYYYPVDVTNPESYQPLVDALAGREEHVRVFYLSVAPSLFTQITNGVHAAGLITDKSRVALEKPLGRDQASAEEINDRLSAVFS